MLRNGTTLLKAHITAFNPWKKRPAGLNLHGRPQMVNPGYFRVRYRQKNPDDPTRLLKPSHVILMRCHVCNRTKFVPLSRKHHFHLCCEDQVMKFYANMKTVMNTENKLVLATRQWDVENQRPWDNPHRPKPKGRSKLKKCQQNREDFGMVGKKIRSKAKRKSQGKRTAEQITAEAETLRKLEIQTLEDEALAFFNLENDRREQQEKTEEAARIQLKLREQLQDKEAFIEELQAQLCETKAIINANRESSLTQIQELSIHCQSLLNEVSHLRSVDEQRRLRYSVEMEEKNRVIKNLTNEVCEVKAQAAQESEVFNQKFLTLQALIEEKQVIVNESDSKATKEESHQHLDCFLQSLRKMEKIMLHNSQLRDQVRRSKIEQGQTKAIVHILHSQLDSNKHQLHDTIVEAKNDLSRAQEEIKQLEAEKHNLCETVEDKNRELLDLRRRLEADRQEFNQKLEQISFDSQYLVNEIKTMQQESLKSLSDLEKTKKEAEEECNRLRIELESVKHKNNDLEALLRDMQRKGEEKNSLLTVQLVNSRTVITKLHQTLTEEREKRAEELQTQTRELQRALNELKQLHDRVSKDVTEQSSAPDDFPNEFPLVVKALSNTQLDLWEAKRQMLELQLNAGKELRRLRGILDAHYVPYQLATDECLISGTPDQWQSLVSDDSTQAMREEMEKIDNNNWQRGLISDQAETIAHLKVELTKSKIVNQENVQNLKDEISCLKKALESMAEGGSRPYVPI